MWWARLSLALLVLVVLSGCDGSADGDEDADDGERAAEASSEGGGSQDPPAGLEGVDAELLNAVAPYDAVSAVDDVMVRFRMDRMTSEFMVECMRPHGLDLEDELLGHEEPDPDRAVDGAAAQFPNIERLARDGLPYEPPTSADEGEPSELGELPEGYEDEMIACAEDPELEDRMGMEDLYGSLLSAWFGEVLEEIEATDEIRERSDEFSDCLREEGIPAEHTADERAFLGYLDVLTFEADGEEQDRRIGEKYGKLYAECGRDLFEARERLRGGERREEFLAEHADAIRQLADYLYGDGS